MARGDQRERDRAKKQKELAKRAGPPPKVSMRPGCCACVLSWQEAFVWMGGETGARLASRRCDDRWAAFVNITSLCVRLSFSFRCLYLPYVMSALPCLTLSDTAIRLSATNRVPQEGSVESRNLNDKAALAAKVAANAAAKKEAEEAAAKAAAQGSAVVAKKKKEKKADASLDDLLSAGLAGGKKKGKK